MGIEEKQVTQRSDVDSRRSQRKGLGGLFETILRRFKDLSQVVMLMPLYALACVCVGVSLLPSLYLFDWVSALSASWPRIIHHFVFGATLAACYFIFGFTLMFLLPVINFVARAKLKPWRGPYFSVESVKWYIHNGAVYLLRYSFLEFITPSPFCTWFYRMMGMKIGRGTIINTTNISDPSLIELGKKVTLGGSATIVGHYGQSGYLVLAPVRIGDGATIGLKATIMGGVTIGKNAKILPNSAVLPNTVIPEGETWGGVPAQKISIFSSRAGG